MYDNDEAMNNKVDLTRQKKKEREKKKKKKKKKESDEKKILKKIEFEQKDSKFSRFFRVGKRKKKLVLGVLPVIFL